MSIFVGSMRENELVNIAFQLVMAAHGWKDFQSKSREEIEAWVRDQLYRSGFPTVPVGSTWGSVVTENYYLEHFNKEQ